MIRHAWQRAVFYVVVATWFAVAYYAAPAFAEWVTTYTEATAP